MSKALVAALMLVSFASAALEAPLPDAQTDALEKFLLDWSREVGIDNVPPILKADNKERRQLLARLNERLQALGLRPINSLTDVTAKKNCVKGFVYDPDCFVGIEIVDSENRFCFPCIVPLNRPYWTIQNKYLPLED